MHQYHHKAGRHTHPVHPHDTGSCHCIFHIFLLYDYLILANLFSQVQDFLKAPALALARRCKNFYFLDSHRRTGSS